MIKRCVRQTFKSICFLQLVKCFVDLGPVSINKIFVLRTHQVPKDRNYQAREKQCDTRRSGRLIRLGKYDLTANDRRLGHQKKIKPRPHPAKVIGEESDL